MTRVALELVPLSRVKSILVTPIKRDSGTFYAVFGIFPTSTHFYMGVSSPPDIIIKFVLYYIFKYSSRRNIAFNILLGILHFISALNFMQ